MTTPPLTAKKLTALHYSHLAAGAQMVDEDGWQRPEHYQGIEEELAAARGRVGLADISPVGKLDVKGLALRISDFGFRISESEVNKDAQDRSKDVQDRQDPGRDIRNRVLAGELVAGDNIFPARCCALAADHWLLLATPEHREAARDAFVAGAPGGAGTGGAYVTDVTSVLAGLALVGPRSREVLRKLTALDVEPATLRDGDCAETGVAGVHALLLRADLGDLLAYELYVTRDVAEFVWGAILDAGREYGIAPIGMAAYRSLQGPWKQGR